MPAKKKSLPPRYTVDLHPQCRLVLDDLTLTHSNGRAIVNAAIWACSRMSPEEQTQMIRAFNRMESGEGSIESPKQTRDRLAREIQVLDRLIAESK